MLSASTNAQEVLDAGNWLLDHQDLKGDDLTKAAADAGFTPSVQALVHFPTVVDMMCRELDWTKQVGDAFSADQGAVLASIQRLRKQAADAGNLKTSPEMTVTTTEQNGQSVIVVQPPSPQVVYVPQYNPQTVYTAPPATTTTTTTSGVSTETAVVGGLLAFGAGMLIGNAIADDDDDDWGYPAWGYGGVYYGGRPYPPYPPYRPAYPGYRPAGAYRPPANYANRYNSNNRYGNTNVNIDNSNNNYFNRFDKNQNRMSSYNPRSPIASPTTRDNYRGQTTYKGENRPRATTNEQRPGNSTRQGADRSGPGGPGDEGYISGRANGSGKRDATADRATTADKCRPTTRRRGGSRLSENHRRACRRHGGHAATRRIDQWRRTQSGRRRPRCQRARSQQHEVGAAAIEQRARQRWRASVRGGGRPGGAVAAIKLRKQT